jgi:hypothetical protein
MLPERTPMTTTTATAPDAAAATRRSRYRRIALLLLGVGLALAAFEWWEITREGKYDPKSVVIAFLGVIVGLPGVIEPRLIVGASRDAKTVAIGFRIVGVALLILGLGLGILASVWLWGGA